MECTVDFVQVRTGQVRTGQVRTVQVRTGQDFYKPKMFSDQRFLRIKIFLDLKIFRTTQKISGPKIFFESSIFLDSKKI